jgi:redox-sensitive bicupin YhaK (pirin superfamily)
VLDGDVRVDGSPLAPLRMLVLPTGAQPLIEATTAAHVLSCGGAPLDGERHLWWNFVASDPSLIERAKQDWLAQRIGKVAGDDEFIPLPEH